MVKDKFITWLHISDLHAGKPNAKWDYEFITDRFLEDLKRMRDEQYFHPDFIFFTGDAIFGHSTLPDAIDIRDQYKLAHDFFNQVCNAFEPQVDKKNLFIVPGNHDVNRTKVTEDQTAWIDSKKDVETIRNLLDSTSLMWIRFMERLHDFKKFLKDLGCDHLLDDPKHLTYNIARTVNGYSIGITGLNSAWSCCRDGEKGKLWLGGLWQIEKAIRIIKGADIKIALIHHPSGWFVPQEDPEVFRQLELEYGFSLNGHDHRNWVEKINNHIRIASSACYYRHDKENGYCFTRLNMNSGTGEVWLRKFESSGLEWIPRIIPRVTDNRGVVPFEIPNIGKPTKKDSRPPKKPRPTKPLPKLVISGSNIPNEFIEKVLNLASEYRINFTVKIRVGDNPFVELIPSGVSSLQFSKIMQEINYFGQQSNQAIRQVENLETEPFVIDGTNNDLIFLKLGGALITDKTQAYVPRLSKLDEIATEIAEALQRKPKMQLVIGHGSGSFGNVTASRFHTRQGVTTENAWRGFAEVWYQVSALNKLVVESLRRAGLPAITISPLASVSAHAGKVNTWDTYSLRFALGKGLLPVIHGDVAFDDVRGGTIISTEELFTYLTPQLFPGRILLAGREPGIWADFPARTQLITEITTANSYVFGTKDIDDTFTGGMVGRLGDMLNLCSKFPHTSVLIFSGEPVGNILNVLTNETDFPGTLIRAPMDWKEDKQNTRV